MDMAQYAVTAVLVEGRSVRAVAASTGRSKSWVQRHVALFREGGAAAFVARKRGPAVAINRTASEMEDAIVAMRKQLSDQGYDAGARTIRYHLMQSETSAPALATIHRVLQRLDPLQVQPAQRDLAGRHDSPTARERRARRDCQLHRRLLEVGALFERGEGGEGR